MLSVNMKLSIINLLSSKSIQISDTELAFCFASSSLIPTWLFVISVAKQRLQVFPLPFQLYQAA